MNDMIGIYIHIPFCKSKCNYCDFCSFPGKENEMDKYVDTLINEIVLYKDLLKDKKVKSIFFGGGTPTTLSNENLKKILCAVKENTNMMEGAEITIEANPETVTYESLCEIKSFGINRISFGLQSANNETLKLIGRIHTYEKFKEAVDNARRAGFENINADIMFSLPNENINDIKNTLSKVIDLNLEHISAYSLIVEEGTEMEHMVQDENLKFPDEDEDREMYYYICDTLKEKGYHQYEISNFAKTGYECRHNIIYWKAEEYVGFGLAAHSYLNDYRFGNPETFSRYYLRINEEKKISALYGKREKSTLKDKISEFMFLGLRMNDGIDTNEFKAKFNIEIDEVYGDILNEMVEDEVLWRENNKIGLTKRGIDVSNIIFAEFMFED